MFYILSGLPFLAFLICTGARNNRQNNDIYGPSVTKKICWTKVSAANALKLQQVSDGVHGCVQSWG